MSISDARKRRLAKMGGRVSTVKDFLGLSPEEQTLVELRLRLAKYLRTLRTARGLTQQQLASAMHSSQSRVAKMEAADASVSIDLFVRALIAAGASLRDVGKAIARGAA